ncbi:MAG: hypothetical protein LUH45_01620 [Clostridiales bacterium]|nr:hypothetical protein [Clostridiales bacterium]
MKTYTLKSIGPADERNVIFPADKTRVFIGAQHFSFSLRRGRIHFWAVRRREQLSLAAPPEK